MIYRLFEIVVKCSRRRLFYARLNGVVQSLTLLTVSLGVALYFPSMNSVYVNGNYANGDLLPISYACGISKQRYTAGLSLSPSHMPVAWKHDSLRRSQDAADLAAKGGSMRSVLSSLGSAKLLPVGSLSIWIIGRGLAKQRRNETLSSMMNVGSPSDG